MRALPPITRVVTGHDDSGNAVITEQGPAPAQYPIAAVPGMHFQEIWNTSALPVALDNGADPTQRPLRLAPMPSGGLIRVVDIPPDSIQNQASDDAIAATLAVVGAPANEVGGSRHKLMHRTQTLDYGILVQGELWLMLDEQEVRLTPGDVVVQRGTRHAWSNRTEEMARIVFILHDGYYADGITPRQP